MVEGQSPPGGLGYGWQEPGQRFLSTLRYDKGEMAFSCHLANKPDRKRQEVALCVCV